MTGGEFQSAADHTAELIGIHYDRIAGRYDHVCIGIDPADAPARPGNTRCCVSGGRFGQDMLRGDARDLLFDYVHVRAVGHHPEILRGADALEPVHGELNQGSAATQYVNELFGKFRGAQRPKPASYSTRHYNDMICHIQYYCALKVRQSHLLIIPRFLLSINASSTLVLPATGSMS